MYKPLLQLPQTVWLLGLVSLFNDCASELVYPLVPLYLASVLMAGPKSLGIIEGIAEATSSLLKLFSGLLVDRTRTSKPWVVAGYSIAALARPLISLANMWPVLLALRFADRLGKGLRTSPRDALLAKATPNHQLGLAFGLHRTMDNTGAVIGPLLAAYLLSQQIPLQQIFLWAAIPGLITVGLAMSVKEPVFDVDPKPLYTWTLQGFQPVYRRYLGVLALFTLGNSSNMFLLLQAKELGFSEAGIPLLWALTSASAALFSTPFSALSDRIGRVRLITIGWVAYGLFYLILGLIDQQRWMLWPLFAFYGLFMATTEGVEKALVADLAPKHLLGTAYGWFNMVTGIMLLPASIIFGWLWQTFTPEVAFGFSAGCALSATLLLKVWALPTHA